VISLANSDFTSERAAGSLSATRSTNCCGPN
jgi:hypothetical protein